MAADDPAAHSSHSARCGPVCPIAHFLAHSALSHSVKAGQCKPRFASRTSDSGLPSRKACLLSLRHGTVPLTAQHALQQGRQSLPQHQPHDAQVALCPSLTARARPTLPEKTPQQLGSRDASVLSCRPSFPFPGHTTAHAAHSSSKPGQTRNALRFADGLTVARQLC